jgi:aryl-phospho-beta-D-glucosidase BglC (GH1 family)
MKKRFLFPMAVFMLMGMIIAQETQYGVPLSRINRLRRGYNASLIYYGKYSVDTYKNLKSKGYDHVRVTCKPDMIDGGGKAKSGGIDKFRQVAENAKAAGMGCIISIHKNRTYYIDYKNSKFIALWADIAKQLSDTDPEYLFFESVNEPNITTSPEVPLYNVDEWEDILEQFARAVRANAPDHTIVLSGTQNMRDTTRMGGDTDVCWDQIECLTKAFDRLPEGVDNCIMTTHYYRPMTFTHQVVGPNFFPEIKGVEYPADEANVAYVRNHVDHPWAKQNLDDYLWLWSDRGHFDEQMKKVAIWRAKHNNIFVHIGEFGANGHASKGRDLYFKDIVGAMQKYNIGWAHWCQDYGPQSSWVGLDKELDPYDPNYTGLDNTPANNYSIRNSMRENRMSVFGDAPLGTIEGVRIFDMTGRLLYSTVAQPARSLSSGAYILEPGAHARPVARKIMQ